MLVKDLWALRLHRLQNKISYESETDTEGLSSQVFSSQSESESASASRSSRRRRNDIRPKEGTPSLLETLSLCYTGTLLLRIPVTVADMIGWVNNGDLLYYRAPRVVPLGMRERLPPRYQQMLEPQDLLSPETLHQGILDTLAMFVKDFGMALPPLNIPLILYRWIKDLALPLEVFAGTQRLARALNVSGSFVPSEAVTNVVLRYPEAQLMALIVVATKLLFPIDNIQRSCRAATDLSALGLDWDQWLSLHNEKDKQEKREQLTFEQAFNISESKCFDAADEKLDAYLDWYGNNIASEEVREHGRTAQDADLRKTLFNMFPIGSEQGSATVAHSTSEQTSPKVSTPVRRIVLRERAVCSADSRDNRGMGSSYRRYRHVEELSGPSKLLFEKAALLAGLSLESMVQAVFLTERKVQKSEEALRKSKSIRK